MCAPSCLPLLSVLCVSAPSALNSSLFNFQLFLPLTPSPPPSPTPHKRISPHTPSAIAQTPAHPCNVPERSSALSTSSANSPPAYQSPPLELSPDAIRQTQSL